MDFFSGRLFSSEESQIDSNVFLTAFEAADDSKILKNLKIKRILTLDTVPLDRKQPDITYMFVKASDNPREDLLSRFEECHQFISDGDLKGERVLVHCMAGVSRSATIVISYMMVKNKLSFEEAIKLVRKKRSIIDPNPGFIRQLQIFEKMNRKLDPLNKEYRQFLIGVLRNKMNNSRPWMATNRLPSCPHLDHYFKKLRDLMEDSDNGNHRREDVFKCKKCRFYLFNELNVIQNSDKSGQNVCDSLYVEPLNWMTQYIGQQESGSINCPNCISKLGHFDWSIIECQCDRHKGLDCLLFKVDKKKVDSPSNSMFE